MFCSSTSPSHGRLCISCAKHHGAQELYAGGDIDRSTFEQILEMDDDPTEREFSKSIVYDFFQQAAETFANMEKSL